MYMDPVACYTLRKEAMKRDVLLCNGHSPHSRECRVPASYDSSVNIAASIIPNQKAGARVQADQTDSELVM